MILGGSVNDVLVDGSFVTGREEPGDVDAACYVPPNELRDMINKSTDAGVLTFFLANPHEAKRMLGVHMFVVRTPENLEDFLITFTKGLQGKGLRPADPVRDPKDLIVPKEKGILRVSFAEFFKQVNV